MATPRGYGGRGAARGGRTADRGRGGSGYRSGGGGGSNAALWAIVAGGGLVVLVLVVVLATRGGDAGTTNANLAPAPAPAARPGVPPKAPPKPLTDAERREVHDLMMRLAAHESEAMRLKNQGYEAQNRQDYDKAQEYWHEASTLLRGMIGEAEELFERIGSDRVEQYAYSDYKVREKWQSILSDFFKNLK